MTGTPGGLPSRDAPPSTGPAKGEVKATSGGEFAGLGLQFAVSIVAFLYLGQWLDRKLGTAPWLLIIGVFTGAGAAFYSMYRKLMAAQAREEAASAERKAARTAPGSTGPAS